MRKRPFLRPLFLWIAGTVAQSLLGVASFAWLLLLPVVWAVAVSSSERKERMYEGRWVWGVLLACLLLFLSIQLTHRQELLEDWPFPEEISVYTEGVLTDDPVNKPRSVLCEVRLDSVRYGGQTFPFRRSVFLYLAPDSAARALLPGDRVGCLARFRAAVWKGHRVSATAYCSSSRWKQLPGQERSLLFSALHLRRVLLLRMEQLRLPEEAKASLAAITLGYRGELSREMQQRFSVAGVAHILSVSGFHVAIVCWFVSSLLFFFPKNRMGRWSRYLLMLIFLWAFTYVSGLSVPAVRAALMLTFFLTGQVLRRTGDRYNTLAASAFCMLAYRPLYLFDVGFQLSYLAVFFILYLQPRITKLLDVRNPLLAAPWGWLTVTLAAQLGTAPLCLYYFGQFPVMFLFTNLPIAVLATVLMPVTLLWLLLAPWLSAGNVLQVGTEWLTDSLLWIVRTFSGVPGASYLLHFSFLMLGVSYGVLFLLLLYGRVRRPRILLAGLFLLLILLLLVVIERIIPFNI